MKDQFEIDRPIKQSLKGLHFGLTVHGKYLGENEDYYILEWLRQDKKIHSEPDHRIFGVIKGTIRSCENHSAQKRASEKTET